jgi:hypothetical protein
LEQAFNYYNSESLDRLDKAQQDDQQEKFSPIPENNNAEFTAKSDASKEIYKKRRTIELAWRCMSGIFGDSTSAEGISGR